MDTVPRRKPKLSLVIAIACVAWFGIAAVIILSLAARCDAGELRRFLQSYGVPEGPIVFLLPATACADKK